MSEEKTSSEPETPERDIKKPSNRSTGVAAESLLLTTETIAEALGGLAQASAQAFRSFREELDADNITRFGVSNGCIAGMVAGNASFFEELAKTSRRVQADLLRADEQSETPQQSTIDYDRLAKLVAAEILKTKIIREALELPVEELTEPATRTPTDRSG